MMINQIKILLIGANGQLGIALSKRYPHADKVSVSELDIGIKDAIHRYDFKKYKYIINAAAYTNVDGAETKEGRIDSWKANSFGPLYLSNICRKLGITLIHISTDYVFDGTMKIHSENEDLSPINSYGSSKAAGDIAVMSLEKYYIIRTSWVIGDGKNFISTMIDLANKGMNPAVVNDQFGRLTFTNELVRFISYLLDNDLEYGIYNVSNSGESISWSEIAKYVYEKLGLKNQIVEINTQEYFKNKDDVAVRPKYSTLDLSKIKSSGFKSTDWKKDLDNYLKEKYL